MRIFRRYKLLIALIFVLATVLYLLMPTIVWDGEAGRAITVHVRDHTSRQPIISARVIYKFPDSDPSGGGTMNPAYFGRVIHEGVTNENGDFRWMAHFGAGGGISLLGRKGHFTLHGNIRIEAEGYQPFESPLTMLSGTFRRSIRDESPLDFHIVMHPQ